MKMNIGKFVFLQFGILCASFIGFFVLRIGRSNSLVLSAPVYFALLTGLILGMANTVYFGVIILEKKEKVALAIFYFMFSIMIVTILLITAIPIIIYFTFMLVRLVRNPTIDYLFEDEEEKTIDQITYSNMRKFVSIKSKLYVYKILMLIVYTALIFSISQVIRNTIVLSILLVVLGFISLVLYIRYIDSKNLVQCEKLFSEILNEQCDSVTYCEIYRILERNFPNIQVALMYMSGLNWSDNDKELSRMLNKYIKFKKLKWYKIILYNRGDLDKENETLYHEIMDYYKSRRVSANDRVLYLMQLLEVKRNFRTENYLAALHVANEIVEQKELASRVQLNYYRGACLFHLERFEESKSLLMSVIQNGNTLKQVGLANQLVIDMDSMLS